MSATNPGPLITETMAQLLLEQRHWREAIDIYRELGRRQPEKAPDYQKKVAQIKEFFEPTGRAEPREDRDKLERRLSLLRRALRNLQNTRPDHLKNR